MFGLSHEKFNCKDDNFRCGGVCHHALHNFSNGDRGCDRRTSASSLRVSGVPPVFGRWKVTNPQGIQFRHKRDHARL